MISSSDETGALEVTVCFLEEGVSVFFEETSASLEEVAETVSPAEDVMAILEETSSVSLPQAARPNTSKPHSSKEITVFIFILR